MTKAELISQIAGKTGLTKKAVEEVLDEAFAQIKKAVKKEKRFAYPDFGTFTVKKRKARKGRNPQTGEEIKIPASKTVGFKPAPSFKNSL